MSIFDRVLTSVRDILLMREDIARVTAAQIELEGGVFDHEKRLIRIETIIEFTERASQRRLPEQ